MGLGLSLVWEIVKLHGGTVCVENSSEAGTTVAVSFPPVNRFKKSLLSKLESRLFPIYKFYFFRSS